jgi:DNA polymerase-3 subunit alpha
MKFVSFHTHTTFSYGDGFGTVEEHVERIASLGMSALGISEHGNVNSHAALERESKRFGIKPIFGLEAYFGPVGDKATRQKTHLGIYAMNEEGYHNLNKIVTQSYIDSYQWPTVSPATLKKFNEGIIVFSGCSDSLISCTLLGGKFLGERQDPSGGISEESIDKAGGRLQWFLDVFGPERFFLEVQRFPSLERTCALNEEFAKLGKKHGISLVATADVHYPKPTDNAMQAVLHAARWPSTKSDFRAETSWEYQANLSYPESDKEILDDLVRTGLSRSEAQAAIAQTATLANQCTVELPKAKPLRFKVSNGTTAKDQLKAEVIKGWEKRVKQRPSLKDKKKEYFAKAGQELKLINDKDFSDYFLATSDLVKYAKENDITVGPGRGSAAGSIVCYLLGITEIDPLYPVFSRMIFERFIDPNRTDMPDIDIDFDDELRYKIPGRAREIYGHENVANVANHVGYRGKKALQDIARAYGIPAKTFDPIGKRCSLRVETDDRVDDSIQDVLVSYASEPTVAKLVEKFGDQILQAARLEGNQHSMGIHAGGFVISSEPIPDVCAIYEKESGQGNAKRKVQVIPYEKRDAEHLGMLKMDFLGLTTMGMVGKVRGWKNLDLDWLYGLYYNTDEKVHQKILRLFQDDDITGIFQYEGGTTRKVVRDVQPSTFDELAACNALSRPGPLYGNQTGEYIKVKRGEKDWKRIHAHGFDRHVEWTYGQIVYQEQIMWILRDLANFSTQRVLKVRKIIGKKLGEFQFAELWEEFRNGCASNGVSEEDAERVWGSITTAAGYAFNTSHAYSYALVAWWQAYFKIHYPVEFYAATLAKNGDGKEDIARRTAVLQDAVDHNVKIGDFDPNVMDAQWRPYRDKRTQWTLLPGFRQLPQVGDTTATDIVYWRDFIWKNRDDAPPVQWWNLIDVNGIGEKSIMTMVDFITQEDPLGIFKTEKQLTIIRDQLSNGDFSSFGLPDYGHFYLSDDIPNRNDHIAFVGLAANIVYTDEVETIRSKTGESVAVIKAKMDRPEDTKKATIFAYDEHGEVALRISRWRYSSLSDRLANIKTDHHIIVAYGKVFADRNNNLQVENLWILEPE